MQGNRDEAFDLNKRAVSVQKATLGENSCWTIKAYYRLAVDLYDRAIYNEAKCVATSPFLLSSLAKSFMF